MTKLLYMLPVFTISFGFGTDGDPIRLSYRKTDSSLDCTTIPDGDEAGLRVCCPEGARLENDGVTCKLPKGEGDCKLYGEDGEESEICSDVETELDCELGVIAAEVLDDQGKPWKGDHSYTCFTGPQDDPNSPSYDLEYARKAGDVGPFPGLGGRFGTGDRVKVKGKKTKASKKGAPGQLKVKSQRKAKGKSGEKRAQKKEERPKKNHKEQRRLQDFHKKTAVIVLKIPGQVFSTSYATDAVNSMQRTADEYSACSDRKIQFTDIQAFNVEIPSDCTDVGTPVSECYSYYHTINDECPSWAWYQTALRKLAKEGTPKTWDETILLFPNTGDKPSGQCHYAFAHIGGSVHVSYIRSDHAAKDYPFMHEVGHNIGLHHSGIKNKGEYDDSSDIMGGWGDTTTNGGLRCFHSAHAFAAGYLTNFQTVDKNSIADGGESVAQLKSLTDSASSGGIRILQNWGGKHGDYFLQLRDKDGRDGGIPNNFVDKVRVIQDFGKGQITRDQDVALGPGDTWTDPDGHVKVQVDSIDPSAARAMVKISRKDSQCFNDRKVYLYLHTDRYPSETSWTITNAQGVVVAKAETGTYTARGYTHVAGPYCLDGKHTFTIKDSFSDGLCCSYGDGGFVLADQFGNILNHGGSFGASFEYTFDASPFDCANKGCEWIAFTEDTDWKYYDRDNGDCTQCYSKCDSDPLCTAVECSTGYCSAWLNGACSLSQATASYFTCRRTHTHPDFIAPKCNNEWVGIGRYCMNNHVMHCDEPGGNARLDQLCERGCIADTCA